MNNIITINFPQGCGGHIAGRILSSSLDVAWYNHKQNGSNPWDPYTVDPKFSRLHFNRRFSEDSNKGGVPPVLDIAEKRNRHYNKDTLVPWAKKYYPQKILYPLHASIKSTKEYFVESKHLIIIPNNMDLLTERWMRSSYYYFIDGDKPDFTYGDKYILESKKYNVSVEELIKKDLGKQVNEYRKNISNTDIVIEEVSELYDPNDCEMIMSRLGLNFNMERFLKVMDLVDEYTHL